MGRDERGSGTVLGVGLAGVVLICLTGGLAVGGAVHAGHRAQAAADLAALAAAATVARGESATSACDRAAGISTANGARLVSCRAADDASVRVEVAVEVADEPLGLAVGPARATARAGPPPYGATTGVP